MRFECISKDFENFVLNIKESFQNSEDTFFKKRNTIKIVDFQGKKYAVKSFKIPNIINKIVYRFFRDSKAKRSYFNSLELLNRGIDTPKPIGYLEYGTLFLNRSFYISEFLDFDFEIRAVINNPNFEDRQRVLKEFVKFSYELHNKGVYHHDYSPGNILISKDKNKYKFAIVDVNRMKFLDFTDELRFKNLSRFSTTINDLRFIAKSYAEISGIDEDFAIKTLIHFHNQHQKYLKNKKAIKKLKKPI